MNLMITRLVKLTLESHKIVLFLTLFKSSEEKILSSKGCKKLKLFTDLNHPCIYFTYSEWDSESDLYNYRNSEIFQSIWKTAKTCFAAPAEAWSLNEFNEEVG